MVIKKSKVSRIAIVGFGSAGRKHFKVLKKLRPNIKIILIRSGIGKKYKEEKLAEYIFNNFQDVNLKIDGAIISSPAPYHLKQAKKFIENKIPVLIEKPLSNNFNKINKFKSLCKKYNATVLVGYVLRYSKSLNFFREMINKKKIGKIILVKINCHSYLPDWRPNIDYTKSLSARSELGGGVLLELSHELDYSNWIFGPFKMLHSKIINSGKLNINVEDEAKLKLISKNDVQVFMNLNFNTKKIIRTCEIIASEGNLIWDGIKNNVKFKDKSRKIKNWKFKNKKDILFKEQIAHFIECIEKKIKPKVSLSDGINALNIALKAKVSSKKKKNINIF